MENEAKKAVIFAIPEHRMDEFKERIEKLNKKAAKVGTPKIDFSITGEHTREFKRHPVTDRLLNEPLVIRFIDITVDGIAPKYAGWTFLARIDHEHNGVNIINALPGIELDERYRNTGAICEHCGINRYRKVSYVVKHENGDEKQVGSSCVRDFLGHAAPEQIAALCESIFTFLRDVKDDDFLYGGNYINRLFTSAFLTCVCAVIRVWGWVSSKQAYETGESSTSSYAVRYYREDKEMLKEIGKLEESDGETATKALEWISTAETPNDYMHNLKSLCSMETIDPKHAAYVASLIIAYRKATEKEMVKKAQGQKPVSWFGHPDKGRQKIENAKVVFINEIDGRFGLTYLYKFIVETADCIHKFTYFSSKHMGWKEGDVLNIAFSVKELQEYRGEHQVLITRVKAF